MRFLIALFFLMAAVLFLPVSAQAQSFDQWLVVFKNEARSQGITDQTLERAFANVKPIPRVIELDRKQPERKIGFDEYQAKTISQARINEGRRHLRENWNLLMQIERQYGVQAQYIVALWGKETSYGKNTGGFDIIASLATLAWEGRRGAYFRDELIKALKILQGGHVSRDNFKGSWAGAMGQVQFMPTSWKAYAVDYNNDGHKDIWTNKADAFASAANYLSKSGWKYGERWGREVRVPDSIPASMMDRKIRKTLREWSNLGVRALDGSALPQDDNITAYLVRPRGGNGKTFLGYNNLGVIMKWNNSSFFAISVGELADLIAKQGSAQVSPSVQNYGQTPSSQPIISNTPYYNN
jgi:membrane-bound lytic murein transglycosylase B